MWSARTFPRPCARAARSSSATESRPPERSTRSGAPARRTASSIARSSPTAIARKLVVPGGGEEELRGLGEAPELHLGDVLELEMRAGLVDHRAGHEYLAAGRAGGHPGGEVHLAAVVVAVAVQRVAAVDADARQRALGEALLEAHRPVGEGTRVAADDH